MKKKLSMLVVLGIVGIWCVGCSKADVVVERNQAQISEEDEVEVTEISVEAEVFEISTGSEECSVFVCGAVKKPGVYCLGVDSLKKDALDLAGGFDEGAAEWYINLAESVRDGEKIYFPYQEELVSGCTPLNLNGDESDTLSEDDTSMINSLVNINTADRQALMTLKGIGESRADAIIKYRDEHGFFKDISEICNVGGIKEGLYDKIKNNITVD